MKAVRPALLAVLLPLLGLAVLSGSSAAADWPSTPMSLYGDENFTAEHGVIAGTGTAGDPFVIGSWDVDCRVADHLWRSFEVAGTRAHFVIREVRVLFCNKGAPSINLVNVTNATLENLTFSAAGHGGLTIGYSTGVTVRGGRFTDHFGGGIYVRDSREITIDGIAGESNSLETVAVFGSANVTITNSTFRFDKGDSVVCSGGIRLVVVNNSFTGGPFTGTSGGGLSLAGCPQASVHNNTFHDTAIEIGILTPEDAANFTDNTVDGRPIVIFVGISDLVLDGADVGQVILVDCTRALLANLSLSHSGRAIVLQDSNWTVVRDSNFSGNRIAISLARSSNVSIYHNNFIDNAWRWSQQVIFGVADNLTMDDGYPSGGNFWKNYTGSDNCRGHLQDDCSGSDGIGDTPVVCTEPPQFCHWATDRYPLMAPLPGPSPAPLPAPTPPPPAPEPQPAVVEVIAPSFVRASENVLLKANVSDRDGVARVNVIYRMTGDASPQTITMTEVAPGAFEASIPTKDGGTLEYAVVVVDKRGDETRLPGQGFRTVVVGPIPPADDPLATPVSQSPLPSVGLIALCAVAAGALVFLAIRAHRGRR